MYSIQYTDNVYSIVSVYLKSAARPVLYYIGHVCPTLTFDVSSAPASYICFVSVDIGRSVRHLFGWVTHSRIHVVREITYYIPAIIHCYINKNLVGRYI